MQLNEIIRIPMIEYLAVFVLAGLVALGIWIAGRVRKPKVGLAGVEERS